MSSSLLVRDAIPSDVPVAELIEAGGVGDIMGYVLNAEGYLIDHPINSRVIGLTLGELDKIENVILAAGGLQKVPVIAAALKRSLIDTLVTDERTATALLERHSSITSRFRGGHHGKSTCVLEEARKPWRCRDIANCPRPRWVRGTSALPLILSVCAAVTCIHYYVHGKIGPFRCARADGAGPRSGWV